VKNQQKLDIIYSYSRSISLAIKNLPLVSNHERDHNLLLQMARNVFEGFLSMSKCKALISKKINGMYESKPEPKLH